MKHRYRLTPHLGIVLILGVIIPSVILALMAVRAIQSEEAYIEKQMEGTLLAEVTHTVSLVNSALSQIHESLAESLPEIVVNDPGQPFKIWKERSELVQIPFLLSPKSEICWPHTKGNLTKEEISFLNWNREFLRDQVTIPVYQNIAVVYRDEIIEETRDEERLDKIAEAKPIPAEAESESGEMVQGVQSDREVVRVESQTEEYHGEAYDVQQAVSQFEQNEPLRKRVYEKAKEKGQQTFRRNILLPQKREKKRSTLPQEESILIAESLKFSEILARESTGLIPRFVEEKLRLLFWKKLDNDYVAGCVIHETRMTEKLLSVLPNIYSSVRILTVLDDHSRPIIIPQEDGFERDWQKPFVAREISEMLPRWEAAAYLTDPNLIASRAHTMGLFMWMVIFILLVTIVSGSTFVYKALRSEMILAQQKTTFVANVSHELKTPLTSIRMFAEMLKEKRQIDLKKQNRYLNIMVSETERLTRLINNVLDFSKIEQGKKQYDMVPLNMVHLCKELFESQRVALEHKGFKVTFNSKKVTLMIDGDEEGLKQVLLNILSNAEKYSDSKKEITMHVTKENGRVVVSIEDRGVGIPSAEARKVFKEFYRVDDRLISKARGTGLGLTIAKKIIEDHQGEIGYLPNEGGGSIFQIKLPLEE